MNSLRERIYIDEGYLFRLAEIGKQKNLSVSGLINEIIGDYLELNDNEWQNSDRRRFKRKKVMIPAMLFEKCDEEKSGRYHSTTILDISMGGVKLSIPLDRKGKTEILHKGSEFEVIFSPDEHSEPLVLCCTLARMEHKEYGIQLGAEFIKTDSSSHDHLQNYLM